MQNQLFKKSSMERISSPEKLNDYIQVSNPATWMVLCAALALVIGLLAWGFLGEMTESMTMSGRAQEGMLQCYAPGNSGDQLKAGMEATVYPLGSAGENDAIRGVILSVADHPISYDEACLDIESDFLRASLGITGWNREILLSVDQPLYEGVVYTVSIVTEKLRPMDLIFR